MARSQNVPALSIIVQDVSLDLLSHVRPKCNVFLLEWATEDRVVHYVTHTSVSQITTVFIQLSLVLEEYPYFIVSIGSEQLGHLQLQLVDSSIVAMVPSFGNLPVLTQEMPPLTTALVDKYPWFADLVVRLQWQFGCR